MRVPPASLIVSDLHLTDNPRDLYRWAIFPQLTALCKEHRIVNLFVLGDLCEAKDNHSAALANRVVDGLMQLHDEVCNTYVLMGNHDRIEASVPFFRFLDHIDKVRYIWQPQIIGVNGHRVAMLPHTNNPERDWDDLFDDSGADVAMAHITVRGARAPNGPMPRGVPLSTVVALGCSVISGDVHKPQEVDPVTYVGSPYHVDFGDDHVGRVLIQPNRGDLTSVELSGFPWRHMIKIQQPEDIGRYHIDPGDQAKVRLQLTPQTMDQWKDTSEIVKDVLDRLGCELLGFDYNLEDIIGDSEAIVEDDGRHSPIDIYLNYVKQKELDKPLVAAGRECLDRAISA